MVLVEAKPMKIAIPVTGDHVATVFDASEAFVMLKRGRDDALAPYRTPCRGETCLAKANLLKEQGVGLLICGALSGFMQRFIESSGISVMPFVRGTIEEVVEAYDNGVLGDRRFYLPGCCPRNYPLPGQRRFRGGKENRRCSKT